MKLIITLVLFFTTIAAYSQQRLELLETNIPEAKIQPYADSYLWTRNWWLTSGMVVPVEKGGNALSANSKLTMAGIDSLAKLFREKLPPQLIRFGKLKPRIVFSGGTGRYYILSTIFELDGENIRLLGQFAIGFDNTMHNKMADVMNIQMLPGGDMKTVDKKLLLSIYNRKSTPVEADMQGPGVE